MRILVATHNYPRYEGDPAGAFVQRIARGAAAAGHEVTVVAPHAPGLATRAQEPRLTLHRFRYAPSSLEAVAYRGDMHRASLSPRTVLGLPLFLFAFWNVLRRHAAATRPDVIHAHWWLPAGLLASRLGVPLVVTVHGSDVRLLDRSRLARRLAARVLNRASAVTTVSEFLARDLAAALPEVRDVVRTAPMPIDIESFARGKFVAKADPPRILYAGNLLESKGVDVLLRAFARLRADSVSCRLRILGEGPAAQSLRRLAAGLGISEGVDWSDFVGQQAMPAEYGASTVTVLPTRGNAEGLGLTLVEALLAGCAVVGTPAGGIPEVVLDEETGLLARDGDHDDLAAKLARLLRDRSLRERLQARGEKRVQERFSPETTVPRFLSFYDAAVRDRRPR
jgi:glycosyltransferase involved in cell wall biosynthesis